MRYSRSTLTTECIPRIHSKYGDMVLRLEEKGFFITEYTQVRVLSGLIKNYQLLSGVHLIRIAGVRDARQSPQSLAGPLYTS
jgi:hypothetical protein